MTSELPQQATVVDTIVCPKCNRTLDASAEDCPYCYTPTADKSSARTTHQRLVDRPWLIIVVLLHLGVLGIPLYWNTRYSVRTRLIIVLVSLLYTIFAIAGIVWGIMQIVKLFIA
ncbi:MAG: hypothetical protein ACC628_12820 [Pirellulaceae bacterium]